MTEKATSLVKLNPDFVYQKLMACGKRYLGTDCVIVVDHKWECGTDYLPIDTSKPNEPYDHYINPFEYLF